MIPYDDLVAALSAWRARQGLPVSTIGGGAEAAPQPGSGPTAMHGSGPHGQPGSGPYGQPGSGPHRGGPPTPPPPPISDDAMQVDDAEMLEQYDADGGDYAMSFGHNAEDQTTIGGAPERPTDPSGWGGGGGRGDW